MPIKIKCTKCLTLIAAADSTAGQRVKCPKCATPLLIPSATNSPAAGPNPATNTRPIQPAASAAKNVSTTKKSTPTIPEEPATNNFGLDDPATGADGDLKLDLPLEDLPLETDALEQMRHRKAAMHAPHDAPLDDDAFERMRQRKAAMHTHLDGDIELDPLPDPTAFGLPLQPTVAWSPPQKTMERPVWLIIAGGGVAVLVLLVVAQLVISAVSMAKRSDPEPIETEVAANLPGQEIATAPHETTSEPQVISTSPQEIATAPGAKSAPLIAPKPLVPPPVPALKNDPLFGGFAPGTKEAKDTMAKFEAQFLDMAHYGICLVTALDATGHEIAFSSGFLAKDTGLIITNYQAIKYARSARARFRDGTILPVLGYRARDIDRNLVLLELAGRPKTSSALKLLAGASPPKDAKAVTIGYSRNFEYVSSKGKVQTVGTTDELPSEVRDAVKAFPDSVWIQTDLAMPEGASGFPVLNNVGEVLGFSSWTADNKTPGLAVHARHIQALIDAPSVGTVGLAEINSVLGPKGWFQPQDSKILLAADQIRTLSEVYPATQKETSKLVADFKNILNQLEANHQNDPALAGLILDLADVNLTFISQGGEYANWLRQIIRRTNEPQVACSASIALASIFVSGQTANVNDESEILAVLETIMTKYPDVPLAQITYGELASTLSFEIQHLALGKPAPDIVGSDFGGKELRLSDFRGNIVLLHFFADWAPANLQSNDEVGDLIAKYKDQRVVVLGVNADVKEQFSKVSKYVDLNYRCWLDGAHGPIGSRWNVSVLPYTFILDQQGVIRYRFAGNSGAYLAPCIDELLSGRRSTLAGQIPKIDLDAEFENLNTQITKKPIEEIVEVALAQAQSQRETMTDKQLAQIDSWIKQGLKADPISYSLHVAMAELSLIRNEVPAAVKKLREILARKDLDTKRIEAIKSKLALVLVTCSDDAAKNSAEAFKLIQDAIAHGGDQPALIHIRGMVYLARELIQEARSDLAIVLFNNPDPIAYFHLAQIEMTSRNKPGARDALHKALDSGLKNMPLSAYEQKQLRLLAKATGTFLGNR